MSSLIDGFIEDGDMCRCESRYGRGCCYGRLVIEIEANG